MTTAGVIGRVGIAAGCTLVATAAGDAFVAAGFEVVCGVTTRAGTIDTMHEGFGMRNGFWCRHGIRRLYRPGLDLGLIFFGNACSVGLGDRGLFDHRSVLLIVVVGLDVFGRRLFDCRHPGRGVFFFVFR